MSKKWVWGLLLANALLFSWIRWGGILTTDPDVLAAQAEVHADKVLLLKDKSLSVPESLSPVVAESMPAAASTVEEAEPAPAPAPRLSDVLANPPKIKQCLFWGEFSGSGLADARQKLSTLELGERLAARTIEHASGFWVYMSPLKNQAAVQRKIGQLKALGVNDYFVVQEGEWQRAISLGVFRTERAAENHLASLRKQGVRTAKVGERKSKLRFTQFVISEVGAEIESKVRQFQKELPDSELKMSDCN